jgi:hypothetical protein
VIENTGDGRQRIVGRVTLSQIPSSGLGAAGEKRPAASAPHPFIALEYG